jgi:hypothetical protein
MRKIWITSLTRDEQVVTKLIASVKAYGLQADGHFWVDDLKNLAWSGPVAEITKNETGAWIIAGSSQEVDSASVRYGLSLLALQVFAAKGQAFPIIVVFTDEREIERPMPTPLGNADTLHLSNTSLPVKIVAAVNMPSKPVQSDHYLNVHALPGIGTWLEVGPEGQEWDGAMLGVQEGSIDFHAVGARGALPEKSVLEYPVKGVKVQMGEHEFVTWAVRNKVDAHSSYFVRITGMPRRVLFGPYTSEETAEVNVVTLC